MRRGYEIFDIACDRQQLQGLLEQVAVEAKAVDDAEARRAAQKKKCGTKAKQGDAAIGVGSSSSSSSSVAVAPAEAAAVGRTEEGEVKGENDD